MPRRRQRFSRLEQDFRDAGGEAGTDLRLAGYINFKTGKSKIKVENRPDQKLLARLGVGIIPFGLPPGADFASSTKIAVPITVFSDNGRKLLSLSDADLGYADLDDSDQDYAGYYPALMRVFVTAPNATVKTPRSAITTEEYRRRLGHAYGIPFGRSLTLVGPDDQATGQPTVNTTINDVDEEDCRVALELKVQAASNANDATLKVRSISYEPEVFRKTRPKPLKHDDPKVASLALPPLPV